MDLCNTKLHLTFVPQIKILLLQNSVDQLIMMNKTTNHNITHYINIVYYYINVLNIPCGCGNLH